MIDLSLSLIFIIKKRTSGFDVRWKTISQKAPLQRKIGTELIGRIAVLFSVSSSP